MTVKAIMSYEMAYFMNTAATGSTKEWSQVNTGVEAGSMANNPTVNVNHFIGNKSANKTVTGLDQSMPVEQLAYKGDGVFDFVDDLFFNQATGSDLETEILEVYLYKKTGVTDIPSRLFKAVISPNERGLEGGEQMTLSYDVNYSGDPVFGKTSITAGKPVFTEDPVLP